MARLRFVPWGALAAGILSALALLLSVDVIVSTSDLATRNCHQIELVKTRIRGVIVQGDHRLGRPGSAGYAYYRDHPGELYQAHRLAAAELQTFAAGPC